MANILVIDDSSGVRAVMKGSIKAFEHNPFLAENGEKGLELLLTQPPDSPVALVFLDNHMPGINGYEVSRRIRTDATYAPYSGIPIIGIGDFPDQECAYLTGRLQKPVPLTTLKACIEQYLNKP